MNRYQLAKLVAWADCLRTRKRMQKVVYLLQSAGCPLEAEFILHHYGPYSEEVARLTDEMVRAVLLEEQTSENVVGTQYSYRLPEPIRQQIADLETMEQGQKWLSELASFESLAKDLLTTDLKQLEYASTILYFRRQGFNWPEAVEKARKFKNTPAVQESLGLAQKVMG